MIFNPFFLFFLNELRCFGREGIPSELPYII